MCGSSGKYLETAKANNAWNPKKVSKIIDSGGNGGSGAINKIKAQTQSNIDTAIANANLNRINQSNPFGTSTYTQTGTNPDGTPIYSQETKFSDQQQKLFDLQQDQDYQSGMIGNDLLSQMKRKFAGSESPDAADLSKTRDAYYNQQKAFLDPQWQDSQTALETKLANQGIVQGSTAWNNAMSEQNRERSFAYDNAQNSAIINGGNEQSRLFGLNSQANNDLLNRYNSLRSGATITDPSFQMAPQVGVGGTDVAGIYGQQDAKNQANKNNAVAGGTAVLSTVAAMF